MPKRIVCHNLFNCRLAEGRDGEITFKAGLPYCGNCGQMGEPHICCAFCDHDLCKTSDHYKSIRENTNGRNMIREIMIASLDV